MEDCEEALILVIEDRYREAKEKMRGVRRTDEVVREICGMLDLFIERKFDNCEKLLIDYNPTIKDSNIRTKIHIFKFILSIEISLYKSKLQDIKGILNELRRYENESELARKALLKADEQLKRTNQISELNKFKSLYLENNQLALESTWFIVSADWFAKWKNKVGYKPGNPSLPFDKLQPVLSYEPLGSIDNSQIIDKKDYRELGGNLGVNIRERLVENNDFVLLPENAYTYLSDIYKETEKIPRKVIQDSGRLKVEVYLHHVQLVFFKNDQLLEHRYTSSIKSSLKEVCKAVLLIVNIKTSDEFIKKTQIWKINKKKLPLEKLEKYKSNHEKIKVAEIKQLSPNDTFESIIFEYQDYIFVDHSLNNNFIKFKTPKLPKCSDCGQSLPTQRCSKCSKFFCEACLKKHKKSSTCSKPSFSIMSIFSCFCSSKKQKNSPETSLPLKEKKFDQNDPDLPVFSTPGSVPSLLVKGLKNIGNTCFMNSAIQCLINCEPLSLYFLESNQKLLNKKKIVLAYIELLQEMCGKKSSIAPWDIKSLVSKKAPQFDGSSQHDSQEFLCIFISILHDELNEHANRKIEINELKYTSDEETSKESWSRFALLNKSILIDLAYGQFKSTVTCSKCKKKSITFDVFNCISLPIPQENKDLIDVKFVPYSLLEDLRIISLPNQPNLTLFDLKNKLSKELDLPSEKVKAFEVHEKVPDQEVDYSEKYRKGNSQIFFEVPSFSEALCFICVQFEGFGIQFPFRVIEINPDQSVETFIDQVNEYLRPVQNDLASELKNFNVKISPISTTTINCFICKKKKCEKNCKIISSSDPIQSFLTPERTFYIKATLPKISNQSLSDLKYSEFKKNKAPAGSINLYDCFRVFSNPDILDHHNSWACSVCQTKMKAEKIIQIYKVPPILIIHLKRFKVNRNFREKIISRVSFPVKDLNIQNFVLEKTVATYDLFAVCNHLGSISGGHYTATVFNSKRKSWFECDDSDVTESQGFNESSAYVLFYRSKVL